MIQSDVVVPLLDRQILDLKDKNRQLEARLGQLLRHGEANDLLQTRLHRLGLTLLDASTLTELVCNLHNCFARDFKLSHSVLRVFHAQAAENKDLYCPQHEIITLTRNLATPYCGPYVNDKILSWFSPVSMMQSFCQIALRNLTDEPFGLLVLASDHAERFTFDMSTHYLAQIGELVAHALLSTRLQIS